MYPNRFIGFSIFCKPLKRFCPFVRHLPTTEVVGYSMLPFPQLPARRFFGGPARRFFGGPARRFFGGPARRFFGGQATFYPVKNMESSTL